jgi:hypothetical protein
MASVPYVRRKEVSPVKVFVLVLYIYKISFKSSIHSDLASFIFFFKPLTRTLLVSSAYPFVWGCDTKENL